MESREPDQNPTQNFLFRGEYVGAISKTATTPKRGLVREVCREWLVHEDGALAIQLQDEEIAAHYGHNREKNRMVRQDAPRARMEQEDEFKKALDVQRLERELRLQQEKEDAEIARQLAEELEREEELQRRVRTIRDEQLAKRLQSAAVLNNTKKLVPNPERELPASPVPAESLCGAMRNVDLNHQPMTEEEARQWQELCDAEMARKLQLDEEEESKFRRDVSDLSKRLAIEARDRELACALQEKEKARLRKAKEKARLKAQQKLALMEQNAQQSSDSIQASTTDNIAASIDPTWSRRQKSGSPSFSFQTSHAPIPITDLDMPAPVQSVVPGHRRGTSNYGPTHSEPDVPAEPPKSNSLRSKSGSGKCFHQ